MDNKLKIILSICPDAFEASEEFYLKRMKKFRVEYSEEFISQFQEEFYHLIDDQTYSFSKTCKELSFFAFDKKESEFKIRQYLTNFFVNSGYIK